MYSNNIEQELKMLRFMNHSERIGLLNRTFERMNSQKSFSRWQSFRFHKRTHIAP